MEEVKVKNFFIFTSKAYLRLKYLFINYYKEYSFIEDEKNKTQKVVKNSYQIPNEIISEKLNLNIINYESISSELNENLLEINPLLLTSNFYSIFKEVSKKYTFMKKGLIFSKIV